MGVQQVNLTSRTQAPRRSHAATRAGCVVVALTLAAVGWNSTNERAADTAGLFTANKDVITTVQQALPGAMSSYEMLPKVLKALKPYGVKPKNTIYGQSICSDEINNEKGQISTLMSNYYGKVFPMGGIGGAPYVGKTGFGAFSAHVPDDGHVVVLFGPHIGFSPSGDAAKFLRIGQAKLSTACGAVVAAYNQINAGGVSDDPQDMEQSWLRRKLSAHVGAISKSSSPMIDLVLKAYQEIEKEMLDIVNTNFGSGNLVLIGGIQINMPYPTPGFFLPLHFSVRSASTGPTDLMSAFA
jgi:hypothetical protein